MTNERTSRRVAKIAGRILGLNLSTEDKRIFALGGWGFTWAELRALAASALTQASNKKDWRLRRGGKKPRTTKGGVEG